MVVARCALVGETVRLSGTNVTAKSLEFTTQYVRDSVAAGNFISHISLSNASLNDKFMSLVCDLIKSCPLLHCLDLSKNFFTWKSVKHLSVVLGDCAYLESFLMSDNLLSDKNIDVLLQVLNKLPRLTTLNLARNHLTERSLSAFASHTFNFQSKLTTIDLSYNLMGDSLGHLIATLMCNSPSFLVSVSISFCGIGDNGIRAIGSVLSKCTTLVYCNIEGNFFGADAMHILIQGLNDYDKDSEEARLRRRETSHPCYVQFGGSWHTSTHIDHLSYKSIKACSGSIGEDCRVEDVILQKRFSPIMDSSGTMCLRRTPFGRSDIGEILPTRDIPSFFAAFAGIEVSQLTLVQQQFLREIDSADGFATFSLRDPSYARQQQIQYVQQFSAIHGDTFFHYRTHRDSVFRHLLQLCQTSDASMRMLGIRSGFFSRKDGGARGTSSSEESVAVRGAGFGGEGMVDMYSLVRTSDESTVGKLTEIDNDEESTVGDGEEETKDLGDEESPPNDKLDLGGIKVEEIVSVADIFAEENRLRENRQINERLILAARKLYENKEITSKTAKFWEGMFGNRKYARAAELELIEAMEADTSDLDGFKDILVQYSHLFPSVARRILMYDTMFSRDIERLTAIVSSMRELHGGEAFVMTKRLASELSNLKGSYAKLKILARSKKELPLVESFLLDCAKSAYTGPETMEAIELRSKLASQRRANERELKWIRSKAALSNLLISRDMAGVAQKLAEIEMEGDEVLRVSDEVRLASVLLQEYNDVQETIREAIASNNIAALDAILSRCAYHGFFLESDIEEAMKVLDAISRNPASLIKPILEGLRRSDLAMMEKGFEDMSKLGLRHEALDSVVCSKIFAIKSKIIQEDTLKGNMVKVCLALKNGFSVPTGEILQLVRRATANNFDKDPMMKPYFKVKGLCSLFLNG